MRILATLFFLVCALFFISDLRAQVLIDSISTPVELVENNLVGEGITVTNITFNGSTKAIGGFNDATSRLGFSNGIMLTTGTLTNILGPNNEGQKSASNNQLGDSDLDKLTTGETHDAAVLEFDFEALTDSVSFRYVFASEEYNEFVCSKFNDVFGFFVSGPGIPGTQNIALIPNTTQAVAINSVNNGQIGSFGKAQNCISLSNTAYFVDNTGDTTFQLDGFTTVLTAKMAVQPCQVYHIKLAIADVGDFIYDSGVFFEANSFVNSTDYISVRGETTLGNRMAEACNDGQFCFSRSGDLTKEKVVYFSLSGTASDTVDYTISAHDSIIFPIGSSEVCIDVTTLADVDTESDETIVVEIIDSSICKAPTANLVIYDIDPIFTLDVIKDTTICEGSSVVLVADAKGGSEQFSYTWSNGVGGKFNPVQPDTTTVFYATVVDLCTNDTLIDSAIVTVKPIEIFPTIMPEDTLICKGDSVFVVITGGKEYEWIPSAGVQYPDSNRTFVYPQTKTKYEIKITDTALTDCPVSVFVTVDVFRISAPPLTAVCKDDSVNLSVSGGQSFSWSPLSNITNPTSQTPTVYPTMDETYSVVATDTNGCQDEASTFVRVDTMPSTTISDDQVICSREAVPLTVIGGSGYLWSPKQSVSDPFSSTTQAFPLITTTYVASVFNGACVAMDSVTVFVRKEFTPDFEFETKDCSKKVTFTNLTNEDVLANGDFIWYFGDGDSSKSFNTSHSYKESDSFDVALIINPGTSCMDSISKNVYVKPTTVDSFDLPNVFTPNGDGRNDVFEITVEDGACEVLSLVIFNRWGDKVYSTEDRFSLKWDGTSFNNKEVSPGVYFYVLKTEEESYKGTITLYR